MTDAGKVTVSVEIDASNVPADLHSTVSKALDGVASTAAKGGTTAGASLTKGLSDAVQKGAPEVGGAVTTHVGPALTSAFGQLASQGGQELMTGLTSSITKGIPGIGSALSGITTAMGGIESGAAAAAIGVGISFAAIAVAAVKVGEALYGVGERFDGVYDKLTATTGAIGDDLERLKQNVNNIGANTASSFEDIGAVVGQLRQNLQLSGGDLDTIGKQILDFQRITGQTIDVRGLKDVVRTFKVDASEIPALLNTMADAFQKTGLPVAQLEQSLAQAGPVAETLGLSLGQVTNLLVNFDQSGIDPSRTFMALNTAAKQFADNNIPLQTGLADTVTQMRAFIDAGNDAAALDLAGKVFGERNAQKFVELVREGKLTVDDLNTSFESSSDTIGEMNDRTSDLSENWAIFKNRLSEIAEYLGGPLFDAINKALGGINQLLQGTSQLPPGMISGGKPGTPLVPSQLPGMLNGPLTANQPGGLPGMLLPSDVAQPGQVMPPWYTPPAPPIAGTGQDIAGALAEKPKGGKAEAPLLWPEGTPIPGVDTGPISSSLSSYSMPAVGAMQIPGVSTEGLKPQSMAALQAIFAQFGGTGISLTSGYRAQDPFEWHPGGRGLDIGIPGWDTPQGKAIGDQINAWIQANKEVMGVYGTLWQVAEHYNHIHVSIKDQLSPLLMGGGVTGLPGMTDMTGAGGWTPPDPREIREATEKVQAAEFAAQQAERQARELRADAAQSTIEAAKERIRVTRQELKDARDDLAAKQQGKYSKGGKTGMDFGALPFGDPRKILAGMIMGAGGSDADAQALVGMAFPGGGGGIPGMPSGGMPGMPGPVLTSLPVASAGANWDAIAQKESGGVWNLPTGDRDSTGGLQIRQGTWDEFGGQEFAPSPYLASREQQIQVAERILAKQGPQAWAGGANFVPATPGMTTPGVPGLPTTTLPATTPTLAPAGVTPVFVTNMPGSGIPGAAPGTPGAPGTPAAGTPAGTPAGPAPAGGAPAAAGAAPSGMAGAIQPAIQGIAQSVGGTAGDAVAAALTSSPGFGPLGGKLGVPTAPSTDLAQLAHERNPLFLAQAMGFNVPDYSRFGGGASAQNLMTNGGPASDALGRIYSDTAALIDRTFTNTDAAQKARHDQAMAVFNSVKDRLASDFVKPVTTAAVTAGIDGLGEATTTAIGKAMAAPIASAVATSMPSSSASGGTGAELVNTGANLLTGVGQGVGAVGGFAGGGAVIGPGSGTSDSILARVSHGEWVLTANQVGAMGGFKGVQSIVNSLPRYATGGGVDVSATVGAEFFGVSQVPIIATIVNLLVAVLLKVIGVTITARDTLNEISSDFREFRGDFKAFDAYGRMMNDTSGLVDRTGSSEQAAADERIRILKLVLEGLFKFIVEKIVVPIAKAVGNSLLQAASGALQGGLGAAFPGGSIVGGAVGSIITSAGSAGIDIAGEIGTILAESIFSVGADAIGQLLQSIFPGITTGIFGGGLLSMIVDPITATLNGLFGGISMLFGGLFGGLSTLIPGLPFDDGGVAYGTGWLPKATVRPERVLSPTQTASFDRLVAALESGRGVAKTTIHAPFTVVGSERGGREARDRLLALMS